MPRYKSVILGKTRKVKMGRAECWIKADICVELEEGTTQIDAALVKEVISDIDGILEMEAATEYENSHK